jgi:uncharacterized protein
MADKLLIILLNTDPDNPTELGAPFLQATVAASMEYDVEIVFTGRAGELARRGVADGIQLPGGGERSVHDIMRDAHQAGVKFKVCAPATELWGDDLVPEVEETVGAAYVIGQAMAGGCVTFTY